MSLVWEMTELNSPFTGDLLEALASYMYTDESPPQLGLFCTELPK